MSKQLNKYKVESSRLLKHDYSANAKYFITINTFHNRNYFGTIVQTSQGASQQPNENLHETMDPSSKSKNFPHSQTPLRASLLLTSLGEIAQKNWLAIPHHFPFISLDEFIIMPNHMHGILSFEGIKKEKFEPNKYGSKKASLGTIINLYKGSVTAYANKNGIEFRWQP